MEFKMERWLVTGGAGFLGSHVVEQLVSAGKTVHVIDNLSWGHADFIESLASKITFHQTDLRNRKELDLAVEKIQPTHVVHLAALHFIPAAIKDPSLALEINVIGTQNLLKSLRDKSSYQAFWFASTGDVYAPDEAPHHPTSSTIKPFNIYGLSKLMGEDLIGLETKVLPQTRFIIGRLFNLYGARETNPHILPEILGQMKQQKGDVTLSLGSIWPKRDMVPVDEAAGCIIASMSKASTLSPGTHVYNYATGSAVSMEEMIHVIAKISGRKIDIKLDANKVRSVERAHLQADVQGLKNFLGTTPTASLEAGLKKLLKHESLI
jgi:UDP-glucose 4-epimerase